MLFWRRPGAVPAEEGVGTGVYDFEVLKDGAVIAAEQTIALPDTRAAWPKIAELAKTFDEPGHKIRVKDEAGGIVILIGVTALRRCANLSTGFRPHSQVGASGTMSKQQ